MWNTIALSILLLSSTVFSGKVPSDISEDWTKSVNKVKMECLEQGNTTVEAVDAMLATWDIPESLNCFMTCVFEKNGFVDKDGNFTEVLLQHKGVTQENLRKCENAVEAYNKESCNRVYYFCTCMVSSVSINEV
uniref:Uncharacterized protein n=1 Tax=Photinus pyralis TaxID=7054 RepID=A0A1Y1MRX2_PHOPY